MLLGRQRERELLDEALASARSGRAISLVLLGEAGVGKTALLDYAAERAVGMNVVRMRSLESEAELAFGGLLVVCRPLLRHLASLPERQADALRGALALASGAGDRFVIGAATLSLFASAADEQALLVIVDDANWLDSPSADALLFAAKRLEADSVVMLLAARNDGGLFERTGLDELRIGGLEPADARALVATSSGARCRDDVAERLIESTGGNPLALLELPATLSDAQLRGDEPLPEPLPVTSDLQRAFAHRVTRLGEDARSALLVAAACDTDDLRTIVDALAQTDLGSDALEAAEELELIAIDGATLEFRHPLVRSATYHGAAASERRRAHLALADALAELDDERSAWHRASAAFGRDEEAARLLDATAERSRARAAYAVAANAHERAARLGDESMQTERLARAAESAWLAGRPHHATQLITEALDGDVATDARAELVSLRATIELHRGDQRRAYRWFVEAADLAEPANAERAAQMLAEAISAAIQTAGPELAEIAERLERTPSANDPFVELLIAQALVMAESVLGSDEGIERLQRCVAALDAGRIIPESPIEFFAAARTHWMLGENAKAAQFAREGAWRAREAQASGLLPQLQRLVAVAEYDRGEWTTARAAAADASELAEELGQTSTLCASLGLLAELEAAIGDADMCELHARRASEIAVAVGLDFYRERAERAVGRLGLAQGQLEVAAEQLERVASRLSRSGNRELNVSPLPDLVEIYARIGPREKVDDALARLDALTDPRLPGEEALFERSRGIAAEDGSFSLHFRRALDLHARDPFPFELARTELCFGGRLRRAGERRLAREQLSSAADTFERLGARMWADRARDELRATGQRLRTRSDADVDVLTPREAQIAEQVAQGKSNKEVAATLYLTPKTVEFHLTRVYRKLGVRSRSELVRKLSADAGEWDATPPAYGPKAR